MHYLGTIIRPPSEADSIILQVTTGCSHNSCTFCGAYLDKPFRVKPPHIIREDLHFAARTCQGLHSVFLADGDALAMPHRRLVELLQEIRAILPWVRRINSYASCQNLLGKSEQQLACYRKLGLRRVYLGLESGHDGVLKRVGKGVTSREMILASRKARAAGFFLSVTVLLGLAGKADSEAHAAATARVLNLMEPHQIAILSLMLLPGTPLARQAEDGTFIDVDRFGLFRELKLLVAGLELARAQLQANHASNYFALNGRLPRDKQRLLATIDQALAGRLNLKPESKRAL